MDDEQLETLLRDVTEKINGLPVAKEPLSKDEKTDRRVLNLQKETLEKVKLARVSQSRDAELQNLIVYGMLTSWVGRHSYLMHLLINVRLGRMNI